MTINIFNNKDMKTQILNCLHRCTIFGNSYSWDFGYKKFSSHDNKRENFYQWFVGFSSFFPTPHFNRSRNAKIRYEPG
jgi:hypothetical protein